jgi:NAD(P)-dependent dehydrogenase (short-subunit alcohol dehydrogenase family)
MQRNRQYSAAERYSRRHAVQVGAGIVAAPVLMAGGGAAAAQGETPALKNPRELYPKPPFKQQPQEAPGLASKLQPLADHGEQSYRGSGRLKGRKALITGGDSGIGRAVAIAFAREGADVAIGYLPVEESDAQDVVKLIEAEGRTAVSLPGDIRDEKFCQKLIADAVKQLGGLDILVNNAGQQVWQPSLADLTTEQFDSTFKTNVYAVFWITKAALPHLPAGAAIINTSSVQAYDPSPDLVDYAQTKSCNVSFTKALARQLAEKGIRVNAVTPGPYWTPLNPSGGSPQEKVEQFGGNSPLGRPGQPAEIAPLYVLLASAEASYVTGEVFGSSGGDAPY